MLRLHAQGNALLTSRQGFGPGWVHTHTTGKSLFDFGSRLCSTWPRHYSLNVKEVPERFLNRNCWVPVLLGGSRRYSWDSCVAIWYVIQVGGDHVGVAICFHVEHQGIGVCHTEECLKSYSKERRQILGKLCTMHMEWEPGRESFLLQYARPVGKQKYLMWP